MNKWNKTGKIKTVILVIIAILSLLIPVCETEEEGIELILIPLVFGSIAIPLILRFNRAVLGLEITKPTWNDNPLALKRPLGFFHFGSLFFLTVGLSIILGTAIKFHTLCFFGLTAISFGIGILIGIWLTLKMIK